MPTTKNRPVLWKHKTGQWAKKIGQKIFYFGTDEEKALAAYLDQKEHIKIYGCKPTSGGKADTITTKQLCQEYLAHHKARCEKGLIVWRTYQDYEDICKLFLDAVGRGRKCNLQPNDFAVLRDHLAEGVSLLVLRNRMYRVQQIFQFGLKQRYLSQLPAYGASFEKPNARTLKREKRSQPKKLFTPVQLRTLIKRAEPVMKSMIYLGINAGLGNSDLGRLEFDHIDFETNKVEYDRHKTEEERTFFIWPETAEALKVAIKERPIGGIKSQVYCTVKGNSYFRDKYASNLISNHFKTLLEKCNFYRKGLSFYSLRHSFETFAYEAGGDQPAINRIMGHADDSIAANYRQDIPDEKLKAISDGVRKLVLGK